MKNKISTLFLTALLLIFTLPSLTQAQDRAKIRKAIDQWGTCRNVAITANGGDIALNYRNGCEFSGDVPKTLYDELVKLNKANEFIDDIIITEKGSWLVLYGENGFIWNEIPKSLELKMREYNKKKLVIASVTFNDNGEWILIGDEINTSGTELMETIKDGMNQFGTLWTACLTDDGVAIVYEKGYQFFGNVPDALQERVKTTTFDVFRLKFAPDGAFFISDKDGHYDYTM